MRLALLTAGTALLLCQSAAMAAPNDTPMTKTAPAAETTAPANHANAKSGSMRADVRDMLNKAGYTDIRVAPSSFVIHAKDKNDNPVVMSISPDSFTEVSETGSGAANESSSAAESSGTSEFVSIPNNDDLSSNLVGLAVYNSANQNIGEIKDIAMNQRGRTQAYIVSVGGFLGVGEHYVAINPSDITIAYNDSSKKWHASMNATAAQLKSAPEFKYNGRWSASHT